MAVTAKRYATVRKPYPGRVRQGRYMGLVRHLSLKNRAKVKRVRKEKGIRPAIALAKRLLNGE